MNKVISTLYSEGFWIPAELGRKLGQGMVRFLVYYQECAGMCMHREICRFSFIPKTHMIAHQAYMMLWEAQHGEWIRNPLSTGNQQQEDYIGRPARLSRRVHASRAHMRVIQRSLLAYHIAMQ